MKNQLSKNRIDTDSLSLKYRLASVDLENKKILVTNFRGTEQEKDFTEPANCNGFGRIRHFRLTDTENWMPNPLPIEPARKALGLSPTSMLRAQLFQNAVCNWRCWYCYVPFTLLSANPNYSRWLSASELIDFYLDQDKPPPILDLSGGQPDLAPEWVPWMMSELIFRELEDKVFLWSDDNLSNDYFFKYLQKSDIDLIRSYKKYGRVGCFKGFDETSFSFNTAADPSLYESQFELMKKFMSLGIDLYGYVTLTSPDNENIDSKVCEFIDKLQGIDHYFPLRTIPLEIKLYTPVKSRVNDITDVALSNQMLAIKIWQREIKSRFSDKERSIPICEVPIGVAQ